MVLLGEVFPNFDATTTIGDIKFHDWIGDSWAILFSHPADYTPVCTTELAKAVEMEPEFTKRGVKMIAISCDTVEDHNGWSKDVLGYGGHGGEKLPYPIIADKGRELATSLGMIDPDERNAAGIALTARCVFVIGPDKRLKLSILYPATTGRNFNEILRVIDSLQLTTKHKVATPVNWENGKECMVVPSVSQDDAKKMFPDHKVIEVPSGKSYVRLTPQPK